MIGHDTIMRTEILRRRYLRKDAQGNVIETPEQMFRRVANAIAAIESRYGASEEDIRAIADQFYRLMANGIFLPNSPTLMNAGRENEMLSACFVLPVEDSIDAIFDAVKYAALIQKAGGGTGFSFDRLGMIFGRIGVIRDWFSHTGLRTALGRFGIAPGRQILRAIGAYGCGVAYVAREIAGLLRWFRFSPRIPSAVGSSSCLFPLGFGG